MFRLIGKIIGISFDFVMFLFTGVFWLLWVAIRTMRKRG